MKLHWHRPTSLSPAEAPPWKAAEGYGSKTGNKAQLGWEAAALGSTLSAVGSSKRRHHRRRWTPAAGEKSRYIERVAAESNSKHHHRRSLEATEAEGSRWWLELLAAAERVAAGRELGHMGCT